MEKLIAEAIADEVTRYDDLIAGDVEALPEIVAYQSAEELGCTDNLLGYIEDGLTGEIELVTSDNLDYWIGHPSINWLD